jgi:hypothetical protein
MIGVEPFPDGHEDTKRIDKRIISTPVSNITFSGLKGEKDGLYLIRAYLEMATADGSYGNMPLLQFNGDTANNYAWARHADDGGDRGGGGINGALLGVGAVNLSSKWFLPFIFIEAKKGKFRHVKSVGDYVDSNGVMHDVSSGGVWNNTTSEITSITIKDYNNKNINGGWAKLYKLI